eukprot:scaffold101387_cov22-Tisochrysis_lutea.AAC.3
MQRRIKLSNRPLAPARHAFCIINCMVDLGEKCRSTRQNVTQNVDGQNITSWAHAQQTDVLQNLQDMPFVGALN